MGVFDMEHVVNAPIGQVFSFVNDPKRQHEWLPGIANVEVAPGKAGRGGEVWTLTYAMGPMRSKVKATVVECEENKRIVWTISSGMIEGKQLQTYESMGANSTKHIVHNEFRYKGLMRILAPLMVPMFERSARRSGEKMKRICEAEARTTG